MTRLLLLLLLACQDPTHGAYKVKAVKWLWFGVLGLFLSFCPACWSSRVDRWTFKASQAGS